jgi:magnesium-transporting ATPase (P-type)
MRVQNCLVRTLASAETMGGANHICSDKTGTLTLNKMSTMAVMALNKINTITEQKDSNSLTSNVKNGVGVSRVGEISCWETMMQSVVWNSSARVEKNKDTGILETAGNVTEQGIFKFFANDCGLEGLIKFKDLLKEENVLQVVPFSSKRKRGSIVVRNPSLAGSKGEVRVYCKGAPDFFLMEADPSSDVTYPEMTFVQSEEGQHSLEDTAKVPSELMNDGGPSNDTMINIYKRTVTYFAKNAFRTILVTYRDMTMDEYETLKAENNDFEKPDDRDCLEKELVAVGIFGLQDPLRDGIVDSIK